MELAFIAALQHLPANQRAALILREVLGFSAREVAEILDTTTASVNSALQRARKATEERLPERSQQATLRSLGDEGVREVVQSYVDAWDRGDIEAVVEMLTEDACFSMPPAPSWHRGTESLIGFLDVGPLSGDWRWRNVLVHANGQPTLAFYCWHEGRQAYLAFALNVLTIRDRPHQRRDGVHRTLDRALRPGGVQALAGGADDPRALRRLLRALRVAGRASGSRPTRSPRPGPGESRPGR